MYYQSVVWIPLSKCGHLIDCGDLAVNTVHDGREWPDPAQQGAAQFFFYPPNLAPPYSRLTLSGLKPTMQSVHASVWEVSLPELHQCVLSSSGKNRDGTTEDINLLICRDGTHIQPTHHHNPLLTIHCCCLRRLEHSALSHTLYSGFVAHALCLSKLY